MVFSSLKRATFVKRLNRFVVEASDDKGGHLPLHLPNSGRLRELLLPGKELWFEPFADKGFRKTSGRITLVGDGSENLICIDSFIPNIVVGEALLAGKLAPFSHYTKVKREYKVGASRFDFFLSNDRQGCMLEVKSVTLVEDGVAMFPDAPTLRGVKHLEELAHLKENGMEAAVVFIIARDDAKVFKPNDRTHPAFGQSLRQAQKQGVQVMAWACDVSAEEIQIKRSLPVCL